MKKKPLPLLNKTVQLIIDEFLEEKKLSRKSPLTLQSYQWVLYQFFADRKKTIDEIIPEDILEWLQSRYSPKVKPKSYNQRLTVLAIFFDYCVSEDIIDKTPVKRKLWYAKEPKSIPKYLEKEEQAKVRIEVLNYSIRDRAIISFLESSGVRRAELVSLNKSDLDLERRIAIIKGKGSVERVVSFSDETCYLLKELFKEIPPSEEAIFLNRLGKRLTERSIYNITVKVGKAIALNSPLGPHVFRHTLATNTLSNGSGMKYVSHLLGHKNRNTTKIYARILDQDVINSYKKCMG